MKNILFLTALCLLAFGCKNDNVPEEKVPEEEIPEGGIIICDDCPCPEWFRTDSSLPALYHTEKDGVLYYAVIDGYIPSSIGTLRLFEANGTEIGKDRPSYETLRKLFAEGKFLYNRLCTGNIAGEEAPEEEPSGECDDCFCPEWVGKELKYYAEKTPPSAGNLYYMERDGVSYYAIIDGIDSSKTRTLRLFEADGTEIGEDHEDYDVLRILFVEGKFRYNHPCTIKYLEKQ